MEAGGPKRIEPADPYNSLGINPRAPCAQGSNRFSLSVTRKFQIDSALAKGAMVNLHFITALSRDEERINRERAVDDTPPDIRLTLERIARHPVPKHILPHHRAENMGTVGHFEVDRVRLFDVDLLSGQLLGRPRHIDPPSAEPILKKRLRVSLPSADGETA